MNATRYGKLLYILDQVRTMSRNQHVVGGRGGGADLAQNEHHLMTRQSLAERGGCGKQSPFWTGSGSQV